ncbi:unnamed protein product [Trichobilharzia szidati]|nr:unnamed protein product [Trichobilharzia szidati]
MKNFSSFEPTSVFNQKHNLFKNSFSTGIFVKPFSNSNDFHTQDVYSEARQLLNEWMVKSVFPPDETDLDTDDLKLFTPDRKEIKKEWDHLIQKSCRRNTFSNKFNVSNTLEDTLFSKYNPKNNCSNSFSLSSKSQSTLEKILQHQEEAKARRELRKEELESRRIRQAAEREMRAQALYKAKQDEKLKQAQEKREEELIQQEMVRVRKELELEKHHFEKSRSLHNEFKSSQQEKHSVPKLDFSCISFSSERSLNEDDDGDDLRTTIVSCNSNQNVNEKYLMRRTFNAWHSIIHNIKIQYSTLKTKSEFRFKKKYFIYWKNKLRNIHLNRDIDKAKMDSLELVKKEHIAKQHYEKFRLKQCLLQWKCNVKIWKSNADEMNRESLRHEKEMEFLNNLQNFIKNSETETTNTSDTNNVDNQEKHLSTNRNCLTERQSQKSKAVEIKKKSVNSINSSRSVDGIKYHTTEIHHDENDKKMTRKPSAHSVVMKPHLNKTVIQQRNIIAAQNREIEALKAAHRYSELLLETRAHELAKNILEKAYTKTNERIKSAPASNKAPPTNDEDNKCLQSSSSASLCESNSLDKDSQSVTYQLLKPLPPVIPAIRKNSFVQRMEERAAERARRHAIQEERKLANEQRKKEELAKQLEEEAKRIKEEKKMLIAAQKEKRIREEELKKQTELRLAHQRELNLKAITHRKLSCLRYYGFKPWIKYLHQQHELVQIADKHSENMLTRKTFYAWLSYVKCEREKENKFAQKHYNACLMRRTLNGFKKACEISRQSEISADRWCNQQRLRYYFSLWTQYITDLCIREWQQDEIACMHYKRHLLYQCFKKWTEYPLLQRIHREREYRREQFRKCLLDIVPDFSPPKQEVSEMD